jgi:hypothetical protein
MYQPPSLQEATVLRADDFDPNKAAMRLEKFMEGKLKYYGPQALATRPSSLIGLNGSSDEMGSCLPKQFN